MTGLLSILTTVEISAKSNVCYRGYGEVVLVSNSANYQEKYFKVCILENVFIKESYKYEELAE